MKYKYLCLGCLKTTGHERDLYCSACRKALLFGNSVTHRLSFNKEQLEESEGRVSVKRGVIAPDTNGAHTIMPIPAQSGIRYIEDIPANRHAMSQIASQLFEITTLPSAMLFFANGEPGCITHHIGREKKSLTFYDLAQKTEGFDAEKLTYQGIARLIRRFLPAYIVETERFFTRLLFHYVICDAKADAKRFCLIQRDSGDYGLAPAFLLQSSVIHDQDIPPLALPLFEPGSEPADYESKGFYTRRDFLAFSELIGMDTSLAESILDRFIEQKDRVFYLIERSLLSSAANKIFKKYYLDRLYEISDTFGRPRY